jgi:hypothetical protein
MTTSMIATVTATPTKALAPERAIPTDIGEGPAACANEISDSIEGLLSMYGNSTNLEMGIQKVSCCASG